MTVVLGEITVATVVEESGRWQVRLAELLQPGMYEVEILLGPPDAPLARETRVLEVSRIPRRPLDGEEGPRRAAPDPLDDYRFEAFTDRWRITPPPYEIHDEPSRWNPYDQTILKGDIPVIGDDVFFVLGAKSDTLLEGLSLPTPSGVSTADTGIDFFGEEEAFLGNQLAAVSVELFKGDTAFRPFDWRFRAVVAANLNYLDVQENAVVNPDVRRGTDRTDEHVALQEFFGEWKLADLTAKYDFLSVRVGIQPFSSDFRGFVFTDQNLGIRLFGNAHSNRWQYNLAWFEQLEKDTNSLLNTFELRDQQVGILNVYRQDWPIGHQVSFSVHYLKDEATVHYDENGFLVRPAPVGEAVPHEIETWYFGYAGFGHFGRINVDSAIYYVTGEDSLNPIAGKELKLVDGRFVFEEEVDVSAFMAALELSYDRDWFRPRIGYFFASGDDDLNDRDAEGFDAILENPAFAGGGFSFWNRMGIRLPQTAVALVHRGSLLPDLSSNKEEGQPNYVNPGIHLAFVGLDAEVTPKLEVVATASHLRFDETAVLEGLLFQSDVDDEIGVDLSIGAKYRPLLNENLVLLAGAAAFLPGDGFEEIYEDDDTLYHFFTNFVLTF